MKKIGGILLIAGAVILALTALNATFSTTDNIVDAGDLQINVKKKHSLSWSPIVGVAIMAVGGGAYLLGMKKSFKG